MSLLKRLEQKKQELEQKNTELSAITAQFNTLTNQLTQALQSQVESAKNDNTELENTLKIVSDKSDLALKEIKNALGRYAVVHHQLEQAVVSLPQKISESLSDISLNATDIMPENLYLGSTATRNSRGKIVKLVDRYSRYVMTQYFIYDEKNKLVSIDVEYRPNDNI